MVKRVLFYVGLCIVCGLFGLMLAYYHPVGSVRPTAGEVFIGPELPAPTVAAPTRVPRKVWVTAKELESVLGVWADECGADTSLNELCGASLTIRERGAGAVSRHPWQLILQPPGDAAEISCGFQDSTTASPDGVAISSWRTGFCKGGAFGSSLTAARITFLYNGLDQSVLRARIGTFDLLFTRVSG